MQGFENSGPLSLPTVYPSLALPSTPVVYISFLPMLAVSVCVACSESILLDPAIFLIPLYVALTGRSLHCSMFAAGADFPQE